jgi:hypothetical protein
MRVSASALGIIGFYFAFAGGADSREMIGRKEARRVISRFAGASLSKSAVVIKNISSSDPRLVDVQAELTLAFRMAGDENHKLRLAEVRMGNNQWEDVELIARALGASLQNSCEEPKPIKASTKTEQDLAARRPAECLVRSLLALDASPDAVHVNEVSPLGLPLSSSTSSLVEVRVAAEFRLEKTRKGWQVARIRTNNNEWKDLGALMSGLEKEKVARARADLQSVSDALEAFRRERGFYVKADREAVAIDQISPRYLARAVRVDPWHRPYEYKGSDDHFVLRSLGPDGKPGTVDDIILERYSK